MSASWKKTILDDADKAFTVLEELQSKEWMCRGQSQYGSLFPSIDRGSLKGISRVSKLALERASIDIFRLAARFPHLGETGAATDENIALMVLRHYGVPTRLLDWSHSPYIAAYFACNNTHEDGEIWSFDYRQYHKKAGEQWKKWPETTIDNSGDGDKFRAQLTQFSINPPDWLICAFYGFGFPRQTAQRGFYTMTSLFDLDHAEAIKHLLDDKSAHHLYTIKKSVKRAILDKLHMTYQISRFSLFPDSAGAADTARMIFPKS